MADVFISYAQVDRPKAELLARCIEAEGWSVWWDRLGAAGSKLDRMIERELEAARCVVVAWSRESVQSDWVLGEADEGRERRVLVPVALDERKPPLRFRQLNTVPLQQWAGVTRGAEWRQLVLGITALAGVPGAPRPGSRTLPFEPELGVIPAGELQMGVEHCYQFDNALPVHAVHFKQAFRIGKYPITFAQFDVFVEDAGFDRPGDPSWGRLADHPVVNVSWDDALDYCEWLSEQTKRDYRLPSEAEWEYACRAGTQTQYWWGNRKGYKRCNTADSRCKWSDKSTSPATAFKPNAWGLHDTLGNVNEWMQDRFVHGYDGAPNDGTAWELVKPEDERHYEEDYAENVRVVRGGSWHIGGFDPCALRRHSSASERCDDVGFRVACGSIE